MTEIGERESSFEQKIYPAILKCFDKDRLDLFLQEKNTQGVTAEDLVTFLKEPLVKDELGKGWTYNRDSKWKDRSDNEAFKQTVANSLVKLVANATLRLDYEGDFFSGKTDEEVRKIEELSRWLHRFAIGEDFRGKADSLFPANSSKD